jgi:5-bromo-4-chloroindolyl phosphate hydrolysis protein
MRTFLHFLLYMVVAIAVIVLAAILGAVGAWYFAWLVGTTMIVLISAAGAALLDAQEDHAREALGATGSHGQT